METNEIMFTKFLKSKRLYSEFCRELRSHYGDGRLIEKYLKLRRNKPDSYVIGAFEWDKSKRGQSFWISIDIQWRALYSTK